MRQFRKLGRPVHVWYDAYLPFLQFDTTYCSIFIKRSKMRNGLSYSEAGKLGANKSREIVKLLVEKRINQYNNNPKRCYFCNAPIEYRSKRNKFCNSSCAATFTNCKRSNGDKAKKILITKSKKVILIMHCLFCNTKFTQSNRKQKFCSHACSAKKIQSDIIREIEAGTFSGSVGSFKTYLIIRFGLKCMICGWDKLNQITGKCPIELDHVDGNHENNLRSICPNCHSLTSTYKALNKGNGRHKRMERYKNEKSY